MSASKVYGYTGVEIQNPASTTVNARASILRFTGSVTVSQVGTATVVNVTGGGGVTGTANTVAFFDNAGALAQNTGFAWFNTQRFLSMGLGGVATFRPTNSMIIGTVNAASSLLGTTGNNLYVGVFVSFTQPATSQYFSNLFVSKGLPTVTIGTGSTLSNNILSVGTLNFANNVGLVQSTVLGLSNFTISSAPGAPAEMRCAIVDQDGSINTENVFQPLMFGKLNGVSNLGTTGGVIAMYGYSNDVQGTSFGVLNSWAFGYGNQTVGLFEQVTESMVFGNSNVVRANNKYLYGIDFTPQATAAPYFGVGMFMGFADDANFVFEIANGTSTVDRASSFGIRRNNKSVETKITNLAVQALSILAPNTTVTPTLSMIDITTLGFGAQVLDGTTAITDGGNNGQLLTLRNVGPDTITVPNAANTLQNAGSSAVLTTGSTISYSWSSGLSAWLESARSII